jgi:hypothetical protein
MGERFRSEILDDNAAMPPSASKSREKSRRPDDTADKSVEVALVGVNCAAAFEPPADGGKRSMVNDEKVSNAVAVDGLIIVPRRAPEWMPNADREKPTLSNLSNVTLRRRLAGVT